MRGGSQVQSSTVDAVPDGAAAPSAKTAGSCARNAGSTSSNEAGAGWWEKLALVAAIGAPTARMSSSVRSFAGMRSPTVPWADRKASGTASEALTMRVRPPGQNARAAARASSGTSVP